MTDHLAKAKLRAADFIETEKDSDAEHPDTHEALSRIGHDLAADVIAIERDAAEYVVNAGACRYYVGPSDKGPVFLQKQAAAFRFESAAAARQCIRGLVASGAEQLTTIRPVRLRPKKRRIA